MSERGMNQSDAEVVRFWDDLVTGRAPAEGGSLDPATSGSIRAFQAAAAAPPPQAAREHVTRDVQAAIEKLQRERPGKESTSIERLQERSRLNGHQKNRTLRTPLLDRPMPGARRWPFVQFLAAAVLLLAGLGLGYVAFDPFGNGPDRPALIPAVVLAPATPSPETDPATLLDIAFPAEAIPADGRLSGLAYIYIEPGASGNWFSNCCPGLIVEHILAGTLSFTSEGPARVVRADGTLEEVASDTEITLGAGDTLIARNEANFTAANSDSVPVEMVEWVFLRDPNANFGGHQVAGWGGLGGLSVTDQVPSFTGSVRITLERLVLAPGEGQAPFRSDGLRQFVVPNVETEIVLVFGEEDFVAVDSHGNTTTVYTLEVVPIGASNDDVPIVGLPPS